MGYFLQLVLTLVEVGVQVTLLPQEQGLTAQTHTPPLSPYSMHLPRLATNDPLIEVPLR